MITAKLCDALAQQTMERYVNQCKCDTPEDVANVLMKLASMCGIGMCAVVGQPEAVARLQGTTDYIATTQKAASWKKEVVQ